MKTDGEGLGDGDDASDTSEDGASDTAGHESANATRDEESGGADWANPSNESKEYDMGAW